MRVVTIIQARMGSTRLPGKVLLPLAEQPVLWHIVQRLSATYMVESIVVATSNLTQDDPIAHATTSWGVICFRGSENNLLERHYLAAKEIGADIVVRIPADKPLVHPRLVDNVISDHIRFNADYTSNMPETWPSGMVLPFGLEVEVVGFQALERAYSEASDNIDKEHGLTYIYHHPDKFRIFRVATPRELARPEFRFSLDTQEDYQLLSKVYAALWQENMGPIDVESVINYLTQHPELAAINRDVQQRGVYY